MPLSLLTKLMIYIVVVGFTPGPANVYAMTCALRHNRRHAMGMWWGLLLGFCIAVTAVALASHWLGTAIGHYVTYLKYPGAAYILWLAWLIFRSSGDSSVSDNIRHRECSFVSGMVMQLTNAKMILFDFTAFGTFVLPYSNRLVDLFVVAALLLIAGPGANLVWLVLGLWLKPFFEHHKRTVIIVMAGALVACAIAILLT